MVLKKNTAIVRKLIKKIKNKTIVYWSLFWMFVNNMKITVTQTLFHKTNFESDFKGNGELFDKTVLSNEKKRANSHRGSTS